MSEIIPLLDISNLSDEEIIASRSTILENLSEIPSIYVATEKDIELKEFVPHLASYFAEERKNLIKKVALSATENKEKKKDLWWLNSVYNNKPNKLLEDNKELFERLKKLIFNTENFRSNIEANKIAILFYNKEELSDEDVLFFIEQDKKTKIAYDFGRSSHNYIDHTFYINHPDFFEYILDRKNEDRLLNVLKNEKFEDYRDNLLEAFKVLEQKNYSQFTISETYELFKKEKLFTNVFTEKYCIELANVTPYVAKHFRKTVLKKIAKNQELTKRICDSAIVVDELFTQEQLDFIDDRETIKKITRFSTKFINNKYSPLWCDKDIIANHIMHISSYYREDTIKQFGEISPDIDSVNFVEFLLDMQLANEKADSKKIKTLLSILNHPIFIKHIQSVENQHLFDKVCQLEVRRIESKNKEGFYREQNELTIDFPTQFLSNVDYCISMEKKYPTLQLEKKFIYNLLYSRKYALHYLEKVVATHNTQSLVYLKSKIPEKMYTFFKQAGIEDNVYDFAQAYFEKKALASVLSPSIATVSHVGGELEIKIKEIKPEVKENKKVNKL